MIRLSYNKIDDVVKLYTHNLDFTPVLKNYTGYLVEVQGSNTVGEQVLENVVQVVDMSPTRKPRLSNQE
jgi:hypothetical protein